ncbi:MAG: hemin uptake protein HemP [Pseudomonadota bacterium]
MRIERRSEFERHAPLQRPARTPMQTAGREVSSEDLMGGERMLNIRHGDALYTLRVTRQGKLLLTK